MNLKFWQKRERRFEHYFPIHYLDKDGRYVCNKSVYPKFYKVTDKLSNVTCLNCIKILRRRGHG